jgi:glycerol-3-phosphate dehydrogenase
VLTRAEAVARFPGLRRRGLTGAALWHDYVSTESDRLTFSWALAATAHGAVLANYIEATSLLREGGRVSGIRAVDRQTGRTLEIGARVTVNATGGSVNRLGNGRIPLLTAINLVTRREAGEEALGGLSPSGRALFLVPWRNRAIFGTWESPRLSGSDQAAPATEDIDSFITELNAAFPALDLSRDDVTLVHRGDVPAIVRGDGSAALEGRERIEEHGDPDLRGLVSVAGTKYTTARAVAARVVARVLRLLGHPPSPCRTANLPLPGGDLNDPVATIGEARRELDAVLASDAVPHLVAAYGTRYRDVAALAVERPEWRTPVAPDSPVIGAQLMWAVRHEMAVTLADAVIRRTPLGALGHPGDAAVERAADLVGSELGWSRERKRAEIAAIRAFYEIP